MNVKKILIDELIKNGYSEENGKRVWDLANRSLLHMTPNLSKAFMSLLEFEPYRKNIYQKEIDLIKRNGRNFVKEIGTDQPFNLIDIGCGNGEKAKAILEAFEDKVKIRYCPVNPGDYMIKIATKNVKQLKLKNLEIKPTKSRYDSLQGIAAKMRSNKYQKNVILLHGSILASYEINDYLFNLSEGMIPGGYMIIGNSIRTGERLTNLDVYKQGVFKNWFKHIMFELGFKEDEIEYDARFNSMRVENIFRIKVEKEVTAGKEKIIFRKGDEVLVAFLYKYFEEELEKFFKMYFSDVKVMKDEDNEYILALCRK